MQEVIAPEDSRNQLVRDLRLVFCQSYNSAGTCMIDDKGDLNNEYYLLFKTIKQ